MLQTPDDLAGKDAGVDRALGIVAHDAAEKLHPGVHAPVRVFQADLARRYFSGRCCSCQRPGFTHEPI